MATASIILASAESVSALPPGDPRHSNPKVTLRQVGWPYVALTLPYAPVEVDHEENGAEYIQIERPGREPLLEYKGRRLRQVAFELMIARKVDPGRHSVEDFLTMLRAIATLPVNVRLSYGPSVDTLDWKITEMSYTSVRREEFTNHIAAATVRVTLTEATALLNPIVPGMGEIKYEYRPVAGPSSTKTSPSARTTGRPPTGTDRSATETLPKPKFDEVM